MHAKSDSEVTSLDASSPARSPRRPLYYVQSPSQHDVEKMSFGSSPLGSPHHYHCSPIHHSRESSTTRFSASLKNPRSAGAWKKMNQHDDDENTDDEGERSGHLAKFYVLCFAFSFAVLFTMFSLILWGASKRYKPKIYVKSIVFESFNVQAGIDRSGVPTDMLSLNSTVKIRYRNPATFFGVHVSSSPLDLYYYQLKIASGHVNKLPRQGYMELRLRGLRGPTLCPIHETHPYVLSGSYPFAYVLQKMCNEIFISPKPCVSYCGTMEEFYQSRKSERSTKTRVVGIQVPLYGGVSVLNGAGEDYNENVVVVPFSLAFQVRSRAYVLGRLVKPKFYRSIHCAVTFQGNRLGKPFNLSNSCVYD